MRLSLVIIPAILIWLAAECMGQLPPMPPAVELCHPWWEVHCYDEEDIELIDRVNGGSHSNLLGKTWWMKAHTTKEAPSFEITCGQRYGWINIYWSESLTKPEWMQVYSGGQHGTKFGAQIDMVRFRIYMHPKSPVTARMVLAKSGFFKLSTPNYGSITCDGSFIDWFNEPDARIESINMDGFWPELVGPVPYVATAETSPGLPPIPGI